ncbi:hypothetical protein [Luteimicrobium sp. DT211]|uniref:hypothetical protein n=1 Tax=Luteimicrobium sp. DT211 TaxID=3393412 RepID=UPI003CE89878
MWSNALGLTLTGFALLAAASPVVGAYLLDRRHLLTNRLALGAVASLLVGLGGLTVMVLTPVTDEITCDAAAFDLLGDGFDGGNPPCLAATRTYVGLGLLIVVVATVLWWVAAARTRRRAPATA